MIDKLLKKIKNFYDAYKIWIFVVTLFSTNGIQAGIQSYMGNPPCVKPPVEPVKVAVVEAKEVKQIIQPVNVKVTCKSDTSVREHVKEHHGGR